MGCEQSRESPGETAHRARGPLGNDRLRFFPAAGSHRGGFTHDDHKIGVPPGYLLTQRLKKESAEVFQSASFEFLFARVLSRARKSKLYGSLSARCASSDCGRGSVARKFGCAFPCRRYRALSIWWASTLRFQPCSIARRMCHWRSWRVFARSRRRGLCPPGICPTTGWTNGSSGRASANARM
jgi:hypothetical protein